MRGTWIVVLALSALGCDDTVGGDTATVDAATPGGDSANPPDMAQVDMASQTDMTPSPDMAQADMTLSPDMAQSDMAPQPDMARPDSGGCADRDDACDGRDDDCDGRFDEDLVPTACATGLAGPCAEGISICVGGISGCDLLIEPAAETCDGVDNDCDGRLDEAMDGMGCASGEPGVCAVGSTRCADGVLVCDANRQPTPEVCNGFDDDCDGQTDEGVTGRPCQTGAPGPCAEGRSTCVDGVVGCERVFMPADEICNVIDDDCDGRVDEFEGGAPPAETCNGVDDDCDGHVDEPAPVEPRLYRSNTACVGLALGDIDSDGRLDVVCANAAPFNRSPLRLRYWLNAGGDLGAALSTPATLDRDVGATRVALADLDGDGRFPHLLAVGLNGRPQIFDNVEGQFQMPRALYVVEGDIAPSSAGLAVADVTGDGVLDVITSVRDADRVGWSLLVLVGDGAGDFAEARITPARESRAFVPADIDRDGDLDLIGLSPPQVFVMRGQDDGFGAPEVLFEVTGDAQDMLYADLDRDGFEELVVPGRGEVFYARGAAVDFEAPQAFEGSVQNGGAVVLGDFDCDPSPEVVVVSSGVQDRLQIDDPSRPAGFTALRGNGPFAATADLNGDGGDDLVLSVGDGIQVFWSAPPPP